MRIKKSDIAIIQDNREQNPLIFSWSKIEVGTLQTSDYILKALMAKLL